MLEKDAAVVFHLQADFYRQYLNQILKFSFPEITREAAAAYLSKVVGQAIRRLTTETDVLALISVIGELVKAELGGRWFMIDRPSCNEPYHTVYEPALVTGAGTVFTISSCITGKIKWKVAELDTIFIRARSHMTVPIMWEDFASHRPNLLLIE